LLQELSSIQREHDKQHSHHDELRRLLNAVMIESDHCCSNCHGMVNSRPTPRSNDQIEPTYYGHQNKVRRTKTNSLKQSGLVKQNDKAKKIISTSRENNLIIDLYLSG